MEVASFNYKGWYGLPDKKEYGNASLPICFSEVRAQDNSFENDVGAGS
jgi:hypothetical protein